jgi:hypothetical protein
MRKSAAQLAFANFGGDQVVAKNDHVVAKNDQVVDFDAAARELCVSLWPKPTTAAQLSIHGSITVRQAQRILGREQGFSLTVYGRLMRGLHGEAFHDLIMKGADSAWWREIGQERRIAATRRRKRELEAELRELEAER